MFKSDFIDEKYKLSDRDKRTVFYLFNAEESCNFTTEKYEYTEFCDLNEQFCPACYSEIAEEIKRDFDEHQNCLMQLLAKKQEEAFKDEIFYRMFRHKYCNHEYCCECNEKIELKQDYVLVNPDNNQHLFSHVKQNYFVCSCNDFIYLPVVEGYVFLEQRQTSEDNTKILSPDSIKTGYSLLKTPLSRDANCNYPQNLDSRIRCILDWQIADYLCNNMGQKRLNKKGVFTPCAAENGTIVASKQKWRLRR